MTLPARLPPELWPQVSLLFDEALALPESEHAAWLAALDTAQPAVAPFVRQLLATHASAQALIPPSAELLTLALVSADLKVLEIGRSRNAVLS